jgi:outer membrane protein OmpA-like peptidoglycan-associated protein
MIRPHLSVRAARRSALAAGAALAAALAAACASVQKPATLSQAEEIYRRLEAGGAEQRVEADMIRSREAIAQAQGAVGNNENTVYVSGLGHIALRTAQTAEATNAAALARAAADSLTRLRLSRSLALSEQQRLAQQQQSQAEIEGLRQRNAEANARLDSALTQLRSLVTEITSLRETDRGIVISLSDILFDVNKATLKPGAEANVRRIAAILQQYPDKQISVEGHTDATGSDAYNQKLSEDRAASVKATLVAGGVNPAAITSKGFGKTQAVATNDTPAGRQQNRRVEVVVLGAGKVADALAARHDSTTHGDSTSRGTTPAAPPRR